MTGLVLAAAQGTTGLSPAWAASPIQASVDADGRVAPLTATALQPAVAGRTAATPCADAVPLAPEAARTLVARVAAEERFFPDFVMSVAKVESHYRSTALSDKGAYGLMQLMPETARLFRVDLCDPAGNVRGGIRLLHMLHDRYRNPFFILAAYNAGEEALLKSRGVPPYPETVRFVADVVNDFYAWPTKVPTRKGPAVMAAAASPGVVEVVPVPDAAAPPAKPDAASPWSDGFVMHVE